MQYVELKWHPSNAQEPIDDLFSLAPCKAPEKNQLSKHQSSRGGGGPRPSIQFHREDIFLTFALYFLDSEAFPESSQIEPCHEHEIKQKISVFFAVFVYECFIRVRNVWVFSCYETRLENHLLHRKQQQIIGMKMWVSSPLHASVFRNILIIFCLTSDGALRCLCHAIRETSKKRIDRRKKINNRKEREEIIFDYV